MIGKLKNWIITRFLPVVAREMLLAENRQLKDENERLRHAVALSDQYISGLEAGFKAQRRIVINTGEVKK